MAYEGWANRATWLVALHINNDQGLQDFAMTMAADAASATDYMPGKVRRAAERLQFWFDDMWRFKAEKFTEQAASVTDLLFMDIMSDALANHIEWEEVAVDLLNTYEDGDEDPYADWDYGRSGVNRDR